METFEIPPVRDDGTIPDDATCQEASSFSRGMYTPCGEAATALVYHAKDRRAYYMCAACADHNVKNRGGELRAERSIVRQLVVRTAPDNYDAINVEKSALVAEVERELPDEIASPSEYTAVAELEARLGVFIERYEPLFDESCDYAHKAWKAACRIRSLFIDAPKALKAKAKRLRGAYEQREEQARRAREREIAEEERRKELARRQAEAKLLDKQGQKDMAAAVRSEPVYAPAVSLPSAVPNVKDTGVSSTRKNRTWRIAGCTDLFGGKKDKAARKRAAKLAPREYLDLDDGAITSAVKNRLVAQIPGIEIYEEKV